MAGAQGGDATVAPRPESTTATITALDRDLDDAALGALVGEGLGERVQEQIDAALGALVGEQVGEELGTQVSDALARWSTQHSANWSRT